jgi:dTMP kinase
MTKFITFEGIEGSGKSTQTNLLYQYFLDRKTPAALTREPGGTKVAEEIRNILINGEIDKMDGICETLLNFTARRHHIENFIKPALDLKKTIICDRFFDSTVAYQGFGQNIDLKIIENIQRLAIGDFKPDITFLIDVDVSVAFERIKARAENNRYEKMDKNFHQKVKKGFLQIAKDNSNRVVIINGSRDVKEIHQEILSRLEI